MIEDDLTGMRETAELAMTEVVTISRPTRTPDGAGGTTVSYSTLETTIGRISPPTNIGIQVYGKLIGERQAYTIDLPWNSNTLVGDEAIINSVTYEMIGLLAGTWIITKQFIAVRLG